MFVALLEFCQYGRVEARRSNVTLRDALRAKPHLAIAERKSPTTRQQREEDSGWNDGAFAEVSQFDVGSLSPLYFFVN